MQRVSFLWADLLLTMKKKVRITPAVIALKDNVCSSNWTPLLSPLGWYIQCNRFPQEGQLAGVWACINVCFWVSTCIREPAEVSEVFTFHTLGPGSYNLRSLKSHPITDVQITNPLPPPSSPIDRHPETTAVLCITAETHLPNNRMSGSAAN